MDTTGILHKYKVNRPLTDEEKNLQLFQREKKYEKGLTALTVIRINNTFVESVDKHYEWKGFLSFYMGVLSAMCFSTALALVWLRFTLPPPKPSEEWTNIGMLGLAVFFILLSYISFTILKKEAFTLTHWPVRFNRKNRMVYAFRFDGTVLSVPWDDIFFTLGRGSTVMGHQNWDIRCHVLDAARNTVKETFSMGISSADQSDLRGHWEIYRRYMENGPQAVVGPEDFYLPILYRKEPFLWGLQRGYYIFHGSLLFQIFMTPFLLLHAVGRYFAMLTSKPPIWPAKIEAECAIAPNDPWERDVRHNPPGMWGVPSSRSKKDF